MVGITRLGRWSAGAVAAAMLVGGGLPCGQAGAQTFIPAGPDPTPEAAPPPNSAVQALDTLRPTTPPYFEPVYETLLRAPLPAQIYRQGGIPARMRQLETAWNPSGRVGNYLAGGGIQTADNAFFQSLGTNGRACVTCHQPPSGMGLSLRNIRSRWLATGGTDPLFAPVDGADCPSAVAADRTSGALVGGLTGTGRGPLKKAHSLLVSRGTIRIPLPWPPRTTSGAIKPVEFTLAISPSDDRPGCNTHPSYGLSAGFVSVYRRPPSAAQMNFKTLRATGTGPVLAGSLMWDGREPSLEQQTIDATRGHAQADHDPTPAEIAEIVAFQTGVYSAQISDSEIGRLDSQGGGGGPIILRGRIPRLGFGTTFTEYANWSGLSGKLGSIARGQALFNTRRFTTRNVDGFNDLPSVGNPSALTTCSTCHNISSSGGDFQPNAQRNTGIGGGGVASGGPAAATDLPRFTLTCSSGAKPGFQGRGPIVSNDPGLALITGKCADIGKFTVPQLRALAAREPYFHDGSARTLGAVVSFYNQRFAIGLTEAEQQDLANFLATPLRAPGLRD